MRGIDVSSWNGWPYNAVTEKAYRESDFCIPKATEGTGYVNPYCDKAVQRAIKDGKLWGFYHYANGGSAIAEADFFIKNTRNYFKQGIPVLDWESGGNMAWGSTSWAKQWCDRVYAKTGVYPMIYVQASAINQVANIANKSALWVAGYPTNANSWNAPRFPYSIKPWTAYTLWQFTSGGGIDRNIANINKAGWLAIAGAANAKPSTPTATTSKPSTTTAPKKSVEVIAKEVIAGKWGTGEDRKNRLTKAGYNYAAVQNTVNQLMSKAKTITYTKDLQVGDTVQITAPGNSNAIGNGSKAGGVGWKRKVLHIFPGKAYPYQVGNASGTTGFYKASALKRV